MRLLFGMALAGLLLSSCAYMISAADYIGAVKPEIGYNGIHRLEAWEICSNRSINPKERQKCMEANGFYLGSGMPETIIVQ